MKEKLEGKEEEELFDALMENLFDEGCQAEKYMFQHGYRIGVLMTMEVFEDYNSLFVKQD